MLGFFTTIILFTHFFTKEEIGLFRIIVSYSILFAQFAELGVNTVTIKLFPYFRNKEKKHHGYLGLVFVVSVIGSALSIAAFVLLKPYILNDVLDEPDLFTQYFYYVIPLIFFTVFFNACDTYYRVLYNALKGIVLKEVIQRIAILVVIIMFHFEVLNFQETVLFYCVAQILPTILMFASLIYSKQLYLKPDFNFIDKKLGKHMVSVAFFGIIASFSGVLVINIDTVMIDSFLGLDDVGTYSTMFFFGTLILIPMRTMGKVGAVVVSDSWKNNDMKTINDVYKKSSISLSIIGLFFLIGIWANIDNVFHIIPEKFIDGKYVVLIIGIANLTDNALGISHQILVNSKYYRFQSYFLLGFAILLIVTNYILIPIWGIIGAALASMISKFVFNTTKLAFLYGKFKLQPFSIKTVLLYLIGIAVYFISLLIPKMNNFVVDILVRSTLITVLFMGPVYYLKISEDVNHKIDALFCMVKSLNHKN